jgi:hypothetical protein
MFQNQTGDYSDVEAVNWKQVNFYSLPSYGPNYDAVVPGGCLSAAGRGGEVSLSSPSDPEGEASQLECRVTGFVESVHPLRPPNRQPGACRRWGYPAKDPEAMAPDAGGSPRRAEGLNVQ